MAYEHYGTISQAASRAGISRQTVYDWQKDKEFAAEFEEAERAYCEWLEAEIRRRAVDGVEKPVIYQGKLCTVKVGRKTVPLTINEKSDTLLIFHAKAKMPDKYRDNVHHEHDMKGWAEAADRLREAREREAKAKNASSGS